MAQVVVMAMTDFFTIDRMGDGVSLIAERGVVPWLKCNIWHVQGRDRDLVIDTGMGLSPLKAFVQKETDRPLIAILTHAHFDHAAGLHAFEDRRAHPVEAEVMAAPDWKNTVYGGGWSADHLVHPHVYPDFDPERYLVQPAPLTGYLDEGDVVDLGDRAFQILHLPGHSPGSIGLYETKSKTLFSGDAVYDGDLLDSLELSDPALLLATLDRILKLAPEVIHGGHFPSFGPQRLLEIVEGYRAGGNRIDDIDAWMTEQMRTYEGRCKGCV